MTVRHTVVAIQPIRLGQCRRTTGGSPLFFCMNGAEYRAMVSALGVSVATRHANFVEQLTPTKLGLEAFGGSLTAGDQLQELLTTLPGNFKSLPMAGRGRPVGEWGNGTGAIDRSEVTQPVGGLTDAHDRNRNCFGSGS
jgi:hypothetical protein